jgi:hypothetical protein
MNNLKKWFKNHRFIIVVTDPDPRFKFHWLQFN